MVLDIIWYYDDIMTYFATWCYLWWPHRFLCPAMSSSPFSPNTWTPWTVRTIHQGGKAWTPDLHLLGGVQAVCPWSERSPSATKDRNSPYSPRTNTMMMRAGFRRQCYWVSFILKIGMDGNWASDFLYIRVDLLAEIFGFQQAFAESSSFLTWRKHYSEEKQPKHICVH